MFHFSSGFTMTKTDLKKLRLKIKMYVLFSKWVYYDKDSIKTSLQTHAKS